MDLKLYSNAPEQHYDASIYVVCFAQRPIIQAPSYIFKLDLSNHAVLFALTAFSPSSTLKLLAGLSTAPRLQRLRRKSRRRPALIKSEPFASVTVIFEQEYYRIDSSGKLHVFHQLLYRIETKAGVDG
jgi:hypothetical protein